jgi:hypothetical protein
VQQARQAKIVEVAPPAGDEPRVLLALEGRADERVGHRAVKE